MSWRDYIVADPGVLVGKPVVKGTRIAVELVLQLKARGLSDAEILEDYPRLSSQAIRACMAYAAEIVAGERMHPLSAA